MNHRLPHLLRLVLRSHIMCVVGTERIKMWPRGSKKKIKKRNLHKRRLTPAFLNSYSGKSLPKGHREPSSFRTRRKSSPRAYFVVVTCPSTIARWSYERLVFKIMGVPNHTYLYFILNTRHGLYNGIVSKKSLVLLRYRERWVGIFLAILRTNQTAVAVLIVQCVSCKDWKCLCA